MAGPVSVEDILAKQKAEKEAASKPKFLTKADRAKIALEKRNAEIQSQQQKEEAEKRERIEFERAAEEERRRKDAERYGGRNDGYDRYARGGPQGRYQDDRYGRGGRDGYGQHQQQGYGHGQQNGQQNGQNGHGSYGQGQGGQQGAPSGPRGGAPTGPRSQQNNLSTPNRSSPLAGSSTTGRNGDHSQPTTPGDAAQPTAAELDVIRARYLGEKLGGKKPRLRKMPDKKIVFDWKAEDDTSGDQSRFISENSPAMPVGGMLGGRVVGYENGATSREGTPGSSTTAYADALEKRRAGRGNNDERHWSDKPLDEMKERDWRIFREDFSIAARGGHIPVPLRSWKESNIPPKILEIIEEVGYTEPSPIQRQAIPIGMQNRDLIGIAKTGSGKTAAFVIPMLDYISHLPPLNDENRHKGPYALIMAPTRELANQIESETAKFATRMGYKSVSIIGGRSVEEQQFALRDGAEIIIATPGRLKDMIDKSMIVMTQCRYVVMDEADRMVDLGFEIDLNFILDAMPSSFLKPDSIEATMAGHEEWTGWRVTTLFSATMPPAVQRLSMKYLRKPATVTIGTAGEAVDTVEQRVEFIGSEEKKKARLTDILRNGGFAPPIIIFVNQKKTADMVLKYVHQAGFSGTSLHSDKSQQQREESLQSLRDGNTAVLVATDVAGRGIDVSDVSLVVNFAMPDTIEKYVHRIGRTGRAGKLGVAITFLSEQDDEVMFDLKKEIEKSPISTMNQELARHDAAKTRVTREMKRKREELD